MSLPIDAMTIYELREQNEKQLIKYITDTIRIMNLYGSVFSNDADYYYDEDSYSLKKIFTKINKLTMEELKLQNKVSLIEHVIVIKIVTGMQINMCRQCRCGIANHPHKFSTCSSCFR